VEDYLTFEK